MTEHISKKMAIEINDIINNLNDGEVIFDFSIVNVDINKDGSLINVYFDFIDNKDEQINFIESNFYKIKSQLATHSSFKRFPELRFIYDSAIFFNSMEKS